MGGLASAIASEIGVVRSGANREWGEGLHLRP